VTTLDEHGRLENLPFMPEMLRYCGRRFRVFKRADKTCQYIQGWSIRRLKDCVHLEGVRCDGLEHGGCEAACLLWWKEAWLKRLEDCADAPRGARLTGKVSAGSNEPCLVESILAASRATNSEGEMVYSCQATDVLDFTSHMRMWDPRHYIRDLRSGNLESGLAGNLRGQRALDIVLGILRVLEAAVISLFNQVQMRRHGTVYPFIGGSLAKTPIGTLDLQPGELVQVRSKEEILATLDKQSRNRGLLFDGEMLTYCGGIYRVLRRVHRIIDEKTGKMLDMKYPCMILEGVACRSDYHGLCPRAIYHYWRESWLKRAVDVPAPHPAELMAETCRK
jgi:hypothetical protein